MGQSKFITVARKRVPLWLAGGGAFVALVLGTAMGGASDPTRSDAYLQLADARDAETAQVEEHLATIADLEDELDATEREKAQLTTELRPYREEAARVKAEEAARVKAAEEEAARVAAEAAAAEAARVEAERVAAEQAAARAAQAAAAPAPAAPAPVAAAPAPNAYYENCTAARNAGAAPVRAGDPGYGRHLDRDGDGVGCE